MNVNINKFINALDYGWQRETAYPKEQSKWNINNKSIGQCAITALLAQDYFGGIIKCGYISSENYNHYWNFFNKQDYDFTINQFKDKKIKIMYKGIKNRSSLLKNHDTNYRYEFLKKNVNEFLTKCSNIDKSINNCRRCKTDHTNSENIYFGKNNDFLFVGEAPAKNGWRVTHKAWINEKGAIIPSGKILQKLLNEININLFDINFVELIKCFPYNRKKLSAYAKNCLNFFTSQVELLQPKVIITLGAIPTKIILDNIKFDKLSEVVGKKFNYNLNPNITIIPIYHPSPISPKSFKGNLPIFKNILQEYVL